MQYNIILGLIPKRMSTMSNNNAGYNCSNFNFKLEN